MIRLVGEEKMVLKWKGKEYSLPGIKQLTLVVGCGSGVYIDSLKVVRGGVEDGEGKGRPNLRGFVHPQQFPLSPTSEGLHTNLQNKLQI